VDYHAHGRDWRLSVRDDGVGMPLDAARAIPGLGTSIIQALAGNSTLKSKSRALVQARLFRSFM